MLFEEADTQTVLGRIVSRVNTDPSWRDDLMQEAIIHLWLVEIERPTQSRSWYLQSCQFHLRHYLTKGRSIDSWKRHERAVPLSDEADEGQGFSLADLADENELPDINSGESLYLLRARLSLSQQRVLEYLVQGLSSREIGSKLGVSHNAVLKRRRKIARVARTLGIGRS